MMLFHNILLTIIQMSVMNHAQQQATTIFLILVEKQIISIALSKNSANYLIIIQKLGYIRNVASAKITYIIGIVNAKTFALTMV